MIPLVFSTIISCSDAILIVNRLTSVAGLSSRQKIEIISEIRKIVPTCPVIIRKDEPKQK